MEKTKLETFPEAAITETDIVDSTQACLNEIRQIPLLTDKETIYLAQQVRLGDYEAREKLTISNLRLVASIAKPYAAYDNGLGILDLIQEGVFGLIIAIEKFDPNQNVKLSTYAFPWIKKSISRAIANHGRLIRIPVNQYTNLNLIRKIEREYLQKGKFATLSELAQQIGTTEENIRWLKLISGKPTSLDLEIDEDGARIMDFIIDDSTEGPDNITVQRIMSEKLYTTLLTVLNEREQYIIISRSGFVGDVQTYQKIGEALNISRERVRQIESRAHKKLKPYLSESQQP